MHSEFVERPDGFHHAIPINIDDIDDIPEEIRRIFHNRPKFPPTDGDELELEEESSSHHGDGRDDIDDEDKIYSECDEIKYDELQCLEAEENGTCVWNDEKGRCEDVRKMNVVNFLDPAQKKLNDRGRIPDDIDEEIRKFLKRLGKVPDVDELNFERVERGSGLINGPISPSAERKKEELKKLRKVSGPKTVRL